MDDRNTRHPASLYETFGPANARPVAERLEIRYTPKHGNWLNMAGIELEVLARQCLERRIPDREVLRREVGAWQEHRNLDTARVGWRFTTQDAHIKLITRQPISGGSIRERHADETPQGQPVEHDGDQQRARDGYRKFDHPAGD